MRIQRDAASPGGAFTLSSPALLGGPRPRPGLLGGEGPQLRLDPEIEAALWAIDHSLAAPAIRSGLVDLNLDPSAVAAPPGPHPALAPGAAPTPTAPLVPAGAGPQTPQPAGASDLLEAIAQVPAIDAAVSSLREQAFTAVRNDWRQLRAGEKVAAVSAVATIGLASLSGAASDPQARRILLDQLDGKILPVPGVDYLNVEIGTNPDNLMLGLHVDVGRLLPASLGFGPSSPTAFGEPPRLQRQAADGAARTDAAGPAPPGGGIGAAIVHNAIARRIAAEQSSGQPLPGAVRRSLGASLGRDVKDVRVHAGPGPDELARALDANAFTTGRGIFFRAGRYDPRTASGYRLLAHEVVHTVQQGASTARPAAGAARVTISAPDDPDELAAESAAAAISRNRVEDAARTRRPPGRPQL
jgi:hypothetical protein